MDFELSTVEKDLKAAAREFAEKEFPDIALEYDESEDFPRELWEKAHENGFVGVHIPEEYGGAGLGVLHWAMIGEEFVRVDPGLGLAVTVSTIGSEVLVMHGNEQQKEQYLAPLAEGKTICGICITEPDAGSDVASARTEAVQKGNKFFINGSKMFITNGTIADFLLVFAVTDPENSTYKRHSFFLIDTSTPGLEAVKIEGKMGIRASNTAEVSFQDVEVPEENMVGVRGEGFKQVMDFFNLTRCPVAAQGVGIAQGALDKTIAYVRQRKQFGKALAEFQFVQFKIAELATKIEAARNLYMKAAIAIDKGKPNHVLSAMAKWYGGEIAVEASNWAVQFHGGYGYIKDYGIEKLYRDAKIVEIVEGAKEIEKLIIGRSLLKL